MPIYEHTLKANMNPVFIETGTLHGDTIQKALSVGFRKVISIEASLDLHSKVCTRFSSQSNVSVIHGDSGILLRRILHEIDEPVTFWLDAHGYPFSGTPILEELAAIEAHRWKKKDIILIDDVRIFRGNFEWARQQNIDEVMLLERLRRVNPNYVLTYEDCDYRGDILVAKEVTAS